MDVRVLVVDPASTEAEAVVRALENRGYQTVLTSTCVDACAELGPFDCGVFTSELPDGNGVSLAGWLLAEERIASVVFFDPNAESPTLSRAKNLGPVVPRSAGAEAVGDAVARTVKALGERARAVGAADRAQPERPDLKSGRRPKRPL